MIIAYDNTPNGVDMIWHDNEEYAEFMTPTQSDNLVGSTNVSPLKMIVIPYEMIQYIEGYFDKNSAVAYVEKLKSTLGVTNHKRAMDIISKNADAYNIKYITE